MANPIKELEKVNEELTQAPLEKISRTLYKYKSPPVQSCIGKYEEEAPSHNTRSKRSTINMTQEVML